MTWKQQAVGTQQAASAQEANDSPSSPQRIKDATQRQISNIKESNYYYLHENTRFKHFIQQIEVPKETGDDKDVLILSPTEKDYDDLEVEEVEENLAEIVENKPDKFVTHLDEEGNRIKPNKQLARSMHKEGPIARAEAIRSIDKAK